ncbi:MAG TPA: glycosyltransferase family 87 protein [Candidatus Limnocylindrales bacterium]|nr:glycosyltransferase family 87 protein [Candidatus Limnocylindrales bacterium]
MTWSRGTAGLLAWAALSGLGAAVFVLLLPQARGDDLLAYWAVDPSHPYTLSTSLQVLGSFDYSPPVAALFALLHALPWDAVRAGWLAAQLVVLALIGRRWTLALLAFPPVTSDLLWGNIDIFLAGMIVLGLRRPVAWLFGVLTKISPGIGLVWHAVRGEWRAVAASAVVLLAIVAASLWLQGPGIWLEWLDALGRLSRAPIPADALQVPLLPRAVAAVALIAWGGFTGRRWTVPVAVVLAIHTLWLISFTPLIALIPLARAGWADQASPEITPR